MTRRTLMGHTFTECHLFIQPKNGSWRLRTLRLPRKPRHSGRTASHPLGEHFDTPFVLRLSKYERASGYLTAVFRFTIFSTQDIHFEFECRDGHGNLPGFQDLGVEFADQPD